MLWEAGAEPPRWAVRIPQRLAVLLHRARVAEGAVSCAFLLSFRPNLCAGFQRVSQVLLYFISQKCFMLMKVCAFPAHQARPPPHPPLAPTPQFHTTTASSKAAGSQVHEPGKHGASVFAVTRCSRKPFFGAENAAHVVEQGV